TKDDGRHARVFWATRCVSPVPAADPGAAEPLRSHAGGAVRAIVGPADSRMPGAAAARGSARRRAGADGLRTVQRLHWSAESVRLTFWAADWRMAGLFAVRRLPATDVVRLSSGSVRRLPATDVVRLPSGSVRRLRGPPGLSVTPLPTALRGGRHVARPSSRSGWATGLSRAGRAVHGRNLRLAAADREPAPRRSAGA